MTDSFDLIVIGAGPSGMMAGITAARAGAKVLILEAQKKCGMKINASGGGRCNITNTQSSDTVMDRYGRFGRFMEPALRDFDGSAIVAFFAEIGVQCHAPDGFHYWPITHKATTVTNALLAELERLGAIVHCNTAVTDLLLTDNRITGVQTADQDYHGTRILIATGGLGYPQIGGNDSGLQLAQSAGHSLVDCHPAMQPLYCRETWMASCTAHTIPKVTLRVDLKKHKKLQSTGALIFTDRGIAGPVVKDFAREVTPLIDNYQTVPLLANFVQGRHADECLQVLKKKVLTLGGAVPAIDILVSLAPEPVLQAAVDALKINIDIINDSYSQFSGADRDALIRWLIHCPLTVTGSSGFRQAMVTRGGVSLKGIDPHTLSSKHITGLYFSGEAVDLDGPCGGFNLTWAWASGRLVGLQCV